MSNPKIKTPKLAKRLLDWSDLAALGISFHPNSIRRLIAAGRFPAPVKLNEGNGGTVAFIASEIEEWIENRAAKNRVSYKVEA